MTGERGLISASTLQNSSAAAEELPYESSDCCSDCHSSATLPLLLAVRLGIRGFRLSSVGKAAGGGGTPPVVRSGTHAGENETEIYHTVKMTTDSDLTLSCGVK